MQTKSKEYELHVSLLNTLIYVTMNPSSQSILIFTIKSLHPLHLHLLLMKLCWLCNQRSGKVRDRETETEEKKKKFKEPIQTIGSIQSSSHTTKNFTTNYLNHPSIGQHNTKNHTISSSAESIQTTLNHPLYHKSAIVTTTHVERTTHQLQE